MINHLPKRMQKPMNTKPTFVHLHVHSDYSLLDSTCRVKYLVKRAAEFGMPALAITDHGNMSGALDLYKACSDLKKLTGQVVKPIIGCEFYVAPGDQQDKAARAHASGYHLVLLAENNDGYANLCRLNAAAWLKGHHGNPQVNVEMLRQYSSGLIGLTGCMAGEVPAKRINDGMASARQALAVLCDIFGPNHLFVEIQDHGLDAEATALPGLVALAQEFGLGLVATNDVHYLQKEDAAAHEILLCIGAQTTLADPHHPKLNAPEYYLKSPEEMADRFGCLPEALANTIRIAERCNVTFDFKTLHYPVYPCPAEFGSREAYLRQLCVTGLQERYGIDAAAPDLTLEQQEKVTRMDYELGVIARMGFTSYYLMVWDILRHARQQGIPVGPGRCHAAGSLAAYLTYITDIDPIRYGLLFERFLNPDRVGPPVFDLELCERRCGEVVEYVRSKYGAEYVALAGGFTVFNAKTVLKEVARAMGRPPADGDRLAQFIPDDPKMTLNKALEGYTEYWKSGVPVPPITEFVAFIEATPWAQQVLTYCDVLEGLNYGMGVHDTGWMDEHGTGVMLGDHRLDQLVPLCRDAHGEVITQYSDRDCEALGVLKLDLLGLKPLTIIDDVVKRIAKTTGVIVDLNTLPLDDRKTYELLNRGDTAGVFQVEDSELQSVCRQVDVADFAELCAAVKFGRQGWFYQCPDWFLSQYCARKANRRRIRYVHPIVKPILKETYGLMLYQEQIMQVVQKVAGFSLAQADNLRRAMGKKNLAEMQKMRAMFVEGCGKNGISQDKSADIWDNIVRSAGCAFNKSYAVTRALLLYRAAWLKAHFPAEFQAAQDAYRTIGQSRSDSTTTRG
jgi:DNA polymerase-3 subunit alpha